MSTSLKTAPLWVVLLCWSPPAHAGDSTATARGVFADARDAYARGDYQRAARGFDEAYRLTSRPELLFDIAQCLRQLKDFARAATFYQQYLETASDSPHADLARGLLAEMQARPTRLVLVAPPEAPAPGASLLSPPAEPRVELSTTETKGGGLLQSPWFWGGVAVAAAAVTGGVLLATVKPGGPTPGSLGTVDLR